jgi:hypothetical protein
MRLNDEMQIVELRVSYRYAQAHPWVVQAITGFLSSYFMEQPDFRLQRHGPDLASGMHVWACEAPTTMNMPRLIRRLQVDIPPCHVTEPHQPPARLSYLIDSPSADTSA